MYFMIVFVLCDCFILTNKLCLTQDLASVGSGCEGVVCGIGARLIPEEYTYTCTLSRY